MGNSIDAVIWDMGGVLLRTEDPAPRQKLASELGISESELYAVVFDSDSAKSATSGHIPEEEHWRFVQTHFGLTSNDLLAFRLAFWGGDRLDSILLDFIGSLRPKFRTALLSNAWSDARSQMTQKYRMLHVFDVSIFSAEIGLAKPDPAIYELLLQKLAVSPQRSVFIDDVETNIQAALGVGIHGVLFRNPSQVLEDLALLGVTGGNV